MDDLILKQFDKPDEVRNFEKGKFEIVQMPTMTIGRATYKPGWKWSKDCLLYTSPSPRDFG